jgi:hypothetical protein
MTTPSKNFFRNSRRSGCRHDGTFAVVSAVYQGAERTASDPQVVCRGCGAMRYRNRTNWSPSVDADMAECTFPEGASFLVHASNLTAENVDSAGRAAWEWWVDLEYGRRLLFGRLHPEDIARAESDAAANARETGR